MTGRTLQSPGTINAAKGSAYWHGSRRLSVSYRVSSQDGFSWSPCAEADGRRPYHVPSILRSRSQTGRASHACGTHVQTRQGHDLRAHTESRDAHFEDDLLILLVRLRLNLLSELDHRLELGVVLLILRIAGSVSSRLWPHKVARSLSASIAGSGRLTSALG